MISREPCLKSLSASRKDSFMFKSESLFGMYFCDFEVEIEVNGLGKVKGSGLKMRPYRLNAFF